MAGLCSWHCLCPGSIGPLFPGLLLPYRSAHSDDDDDFREWSGAMTAVYTAQRSATLIALK